MTKSLLKTHRGRNLFFMALLFAFTSCTPPPPIIINDTSPYLHESSGITFPKKLGALSKKRLIIFPKKDLGSSITYAGDDDMQVGSVYLYNESAQNYDPLIGSIVLYGQKNSAVNEIYASEGMGRYAGVRRIFDSSITIKEKKQENDIRLDGLLVRFAYRDEDIQRMSFLVVTIYNRHVLKVRYTCPEYLGEQGEQQFKAFIKDLGDLLRPAWGFQFSPKDSSAKER